MDECTECNKFFEVIDTVRCNTCNTILCKACVEAHLAKEQSANG